MNNTSKWFKIRSKTETPLARLFCLHHAGGSGSFFGNWTGLFPNEIECVPITLPGHSYRYFEPFISDMDALTQELGDLIARLSDIPFAIFGHSMGGLIGYSLTAALEKASRPPLLLGTSATVPPSYLFQHGFLPDIDMSDQGLMTYLKSSGGMYQALEDNPELKSLMLPVLRADFQLCQSFHTWSKVTTPILCFHGNESSPRMKEVVTWSRQTTGEFSLHPFDGGHFYINEQKEAVIKILIDRIRQTMSSKIS